MTVISHIVLHILLFVCKSLRPALMCILEMLVVLGVVPISAPGKSV